MAEQPSLGGAIALQGRNTIAEQLGKMQFQAAQREADRGIKRGIAEAKRIAEIEEKFSIPKGRWNRLVLPEVIRAQKEVLEKAKTLKSERPNNWQNELQNLANDYTVNMQALETKSRELDDYETKTSAINKGNTYFSKEAIKYNKAFEEATSLGDFNQRLKNLGFDPTKASDFIIRSDNSISFTPIPNQKPLESLVSAIEKFDGVTADRLQKRDQFNNLVTEDIRIRPLTYKEADEIKNNPKLADLYSKVPQLPSIEGTIDAILDTNPYFGIQYADERNLPLRRNPDGTIIPQDREVIKQDLLQRVANMREPKTGKSITYAPRQNVFNIGTTKEEGGLAVGGSWAPGEYRAKDYGKPSYAVWDYNYNFDKEPQTINVKPQNTFDSEFDPITAGTKEVQATGLVILLTDTNGNPIDASQADNARKVTNTGIFVRLKSGTDYIFQKVDNYNNLSSQFLKKPSEQLNKDFIDANIKRAAILKNIKNLRAKGEYDFEKFATLPKQ